MSLSCHTHDSIIRRTRPRMDAEVSSDQNIVTNRPRAPPDGGMKECTYWMYLTAILCHVGPPLTPPTVGAQRIWGTLRSRS